MSESLLQAQKAMNHLHLNDTFTSAFLMMFQYVRPFYIQISSYDHFTLTTYKRIIYHNPTKYIV